MACTLGNKCDKNISKRTVLLQFIIKNVVTCFLEHSVESADDPKVHGSFVQMFRRSLLKRTKIADCTPYTRALSLTFATFTSDYICVVL